MLTAHPDTTHSHVDVPILLLLLVTAGLVLVVSTVTPARARGALPEEGATPSTASWAGVLSLPQVVVRGLSVAVLALVVVAGRAGTDDELENVASALAIGAGWPLLVLGSLLLGTLWRWVDPWDALARVVVPGDRSTPAGHVWPAVLLVVPWLWFLGVWARPLDPRSVGAALAAYTVITVAGCVAMGRARWLSSAEPLGLLLSWVGLLSRRRLAAWVPPRGAPALMGALVGGLLFGVVRRTELWSPVAVRAEATALATVALLGGCLVGMAVAEGAARSESGESRGIVGRALVPLVVGVVLAVALARNRLFTSIQLLPGLVGDPLGRGWDLLGSPTAGLDPAPLGAAGLVALQLGVVLSTLLLAAATAPRVVVGDERLPVIVTLAFFGLAAVTALSLH